MVNAHKLRTFHLHCSKGILWLCSPPEVGMFCLDMGLHAEATTNNQTVLLIVDSCGPTL